VRSVGQGGLPRPTENTADSLQSRSRRVNVFLIGLQFKNMNSAAFTFFAGPALSDSVLLDMTWPTKAQRSNQYHFNQILKISAKYLDRPVALSAGTGLNGNCVFQVHGKEDNQTKRRTPAFSPQTQTASRIPADPRSLVGDSGPSKHTRRDCLKQLLFYSWAPPAILACR
jgi:hypothetical protein